MTPAPLHTLAPTKPENVRLLGLDVGTKTIGLAVSDTGQEIATALKTIKRTKFTRDIEALKAIIQEYEISGYIIGYPLNADGTEGPQAQSIRDFAAELAQRSEIVGPDPWIALHDERLSTDSVDDFVGEFVNRKTAKKKGILDKLAAQHILQDALNELAALHNSA